MILLMRCFKFKKIDPLLFSPNLRVISISSIGSHTSLKNSKLYRTKQDFNVNLVSRKFHTSPKRRIGLPPIIWAVLKLMGKGGAILFGRTARNRYRALSKEEQEKIKFKIAGRYDRIAAIIAMFFGSLWLYYLAHLEKTPITGRSRFNAFTKVQFEKIMEYTANKMYEDLQSQLLPVNVYSYDPIYTRIERVVNRILSSNRDFDGISGKKWAISVVNDDEKNAFVLPTGHIFVHKGILEMVANDDQLGFVLAHEISHAILSHGAEQISLAQFLDIFIIFGMAFLWLFIPTDGIAIVTNWFMDYVFKILLTMPYSRTLEQEADEVGLQLAAKACLDVREAPAFWKRMKLIGEFRRDDPSLLVPEFVSTHPSHENRAANLNKLLPDAIFMRKNCGCRPLSVHDPRDDILRLERRLNEEREREKRIMYIKEGKYKSG